MEQTIEPEPLCDPLRRFTQNSGNWWKYNMKVVFHHILSPDLFTLKQQKRHARFANDRWPAVQHRFEQHPRCPVGWPISSGWKHVRKIQGFCSKPFPGWKSKPLIKANRVSRLFRVWTPFLDEIKHFHMYNSVWVRSWIYSASHPVTVITRIITFLVLSP